MSYKNNCIFETNLERCVPHDSQSFRRIICKRHLEEVFGLEAYYHDIENETRSVRVGPYLRPVKNWSFKANEVLLPLRDTVDKNYHGELSGDQYLDNRYLINNKLAHFLHEKCDPELRRSDSRYLYEVIRNMGAPNATDINLGSNVKEHDDAFQTTKVYVQDRYSAINNAILSSKNGKMVAQFKVTDDTLSPFYQFLMTNMHIDSHVFNASLLPDLLQPNVSYVSGVGFVATKRINHPLPLVLEGSHNGTNYYYNVKSVAFNKRSVPVAKQTNPDSNTIRDMVVGSNLSAYGAMC